MLESLYVKSALAYVGLGYLSASAVLPPPRPFLFGTGSLYSSPGWPQTQKYPQVSTS